MRRVVVTGMGMVTPVGRDLESTWSALLEGRSGVGPITLFDARTFPTRIAAEVHDFRLDDYLDDAGRWAEHSPQQQVRPGRRRDGDEGLGPAASRAGARPAAVRRLPRLGRRAAGLPPVRRAWCSETTRDGRVDTAEFTRLGVKELHPIREAEQEPGTPVGPPGQRLRRPGPERQLPDRLRRQLAGHRRGVRADPPRRRRRDPLRRHAQHDPPVRRHRLHPPDRAVHPQRRAHPRQPARSTATATASSSARGPACSSSRSSSTPRRAGRAIHGEIVGYGSTADAFRITDSHDEGRGAIACMREALADARLDPDDIDYINAHGTSTAVNDSIETLAIKRTFGEHGLPGPDLEHQEHDGPPDRRGRQRRGDRLPADDPRRRAAADDQPRPPRPRMRPRLHPARAARAGRSTSRCPTASASAARTSRSS